MIGVHITDGAMVYLRKQSYAENGQIVAVLIDGVATLKRICKSENSLTLLSENPAYSPIVLTGESSESAHILGVAVAYTNYLIK